MSFSVGWGMIPIRKAPSKLSSTRLVQIEELSSYQSLAERTVVSPLPLWLVYYKSINTWANLRQLKNRIDKALFKSPIFGCSKNFQSLCLLNFLTEIKRALANTISTHSPLEYVSCSPEQHNYWILGINERNKGFKSQALYQVLS